MTTIAEEKAAKKAAGSTSSNSRTSNASGGGVAQSEGELLGLLTPRCDDADSCLHIAVADSVQKSCRYCQVPWLATILSMKTIS
jgi:hypothetical protein